MLVIRRHAAAGRHRGAAALDAVYQVAFAFAETHLNQGSQRRVLRALRRIRVVDWHEAIGVRAV